MFFADIGDNLEIIIYIIALVAGLAGNAYRNYAKRKAQEKQMQSEEEQELPEVVFDEPEQAIPEEPSYESEPIFEEYEPPVEEELEMQAEEPVPEVLDSAKTQEGTAVFETTSEELISDDLANDYDRILREDRNEIFENDLSLETPDEKTEATEFDLEKAVIYSEILRPKYIDTDY